MNSSSCNTDFASQIGALWTLPKDIAEDGHGACLPPDYEPDSFLRPITAEAVNSRYRNDRMLDAANFTIHAGVASLLPPGYLPSGWVSCLHPEGARYYVNAKCRVVTDSNIREEKVYNVVSKGIAHFSKMADVLQTPLPENSELYIRAESDEECCSYYIVDHDSQTEFWLQQAESDDLGFYRVVSETHLVYALQEHYWAHVEFFPHRPIAEAVRQEFIACMRHGQLDQMTSLSSTFPYTAEQCEKMLRIVAVPENEARNPYMTCVTARLMGNITRVRFQSFYGEDYARLDRLAYRLYGPSSAPSRWLLTGSKLVFGMDEALTEELNQCFPDRTLIGMVWTRLMTRTVQKWIDSRLMSIALLVISSILLVQPKGQFANYVGLAAMLAALATLLMSMALLHKYQDSAEDSATDGLRTVLDIEHETYGFQPTAIWWSAPRALGIYSAALLSLEIIAMIIESCGVPFAIAAAAIVGAIIVAFLARLVTYGFRTVMQWRRKREEKISPA